MNNDLALIINHKPTWDAFVDILEDEQVKLSKRLETQVNTEELVRINAQYMILHRLKRLRENTLNGIK